AVKIHPGQSGHGAFPELRIDAALHDREQRLIVLIQGPGDGESGTASACPSDREIIGISCIFLGTGIRSALVEDHQDVRSELTLDIDDRLGCKAMDGAVYVGPKPNTLRFDLSQPGETEHLISAAVGDNGCVRSHKPVEARGPSNNLDARSEIQMVRVAQEDRSLDFNQLPRREGLYAGLSAHRHERRGMNRAMIGAQYSGTSIVIPALNSILHYCF